MLTAQAVPLVRAERGPVSMPVRRVSTAVDDLVGAPLEGAGVSVLGADLVELRQDIDRLEAEFSRRLSRFGELDGHQADGAPSVVGWLRGHCGLSAAGAAQRLEIAQKLPDIPGATALFQSGEIGYGHAAALARTADEVGPEAARMAALQLLNAAERLDPDRLRVVGTQLRHTVDPQGALADAIRAHQRRRLHFGRGLDGTFILDGLLDAEGGEVLKTAVDALSKPVPGDQRSADQRRADALVELAHRQLQHGELPSSHGQRPHVVVSIPLASLQGAGDTPGAELNGQSVITRQAARRIACDATRFEVVEAAGGAALAVGQTKRTIPASLRRALERRDRGCRFPGCDRRVSWCEGHHLTHVVDGGKTTLANLVLLCRWHHRWVHEYGWTLRRTPGGELEAQPP